MEGIYIQHSASYSTWKAEAESRHRDRLAIVWKWEEGWQLEGAKKYGPNVVSFLITEEWKQWYVVGAYVLSNKQPMVRWIEQDLVQCLEQTDILLMGDLNARINQPQYQQEKEPANIIAAHCLEGQVQQFLYWRHYRGMKGWNWRMWL